VKKPWNDSDLARLSDDLDEELNAIFDQVEAALNPRDRRLSDDGWTYEAPEAGEADEPDSGSLPAIAPATLLAEEHFEDLDIDVALGSASPFAGPDEAGTGWLEPGLLGEPEMSAGPLTPEVVRELSRIIEAAVERGVAAALAKMKDR